MKKNQSLQAMGVKRILWLFLLVLLAGRSAAQEYPRVILAGDYPDPSVLRDGDDYYLTHSSFRYAPGLLIWHSKNLHEWEPLCRVLPEGGGSVMAPELVKHKERYHIYYPAGGTNWVIWADDIRGPWSRPSI